ncbi:MAG: DNA glycosylase AlkZ-like family protein, partial [Candidatus Limnocylindrales bacterium]
LQDSVHRAALLSLHARVAGTTPSSWEHPSLLQVWGPRYSLFVVAAEDLAVFTLGRLPDDAAGRRRAEDMAARLEALLAGASMTYSQAGHALGLNPNALRYGATTGRIVLRWDGARRPTVWTRPPPEVDPGAARLELCRRYLHVFGPATPAGFRSWGGIGRREAGAAFEALAPEVTPVRTPIGEAWILSRDEPDFRAAPEPPAAARLLPSGDAYFLLQGADRELLVPEAAGRRSLWTTRVWPGAVLAEGEIVGTWRRSKASLTIEAWRPLTLDTRRAVEAEAGSLPLPGEGRLTITWSA